MYAVEKKILQRKFGDCEQAISRVIATSVYLLTT